MTLQSLDGPITGVMNAPEYIWDDVYYSDHAVNLSLRQFEFDYMAENDCTEEDIPVDAYEMYSEYAQEEEYTAKGLKISVLPVWKWLLANEM